MEKQEHSNYFLLLEGYQALGTRFWVECFGLSGDQRKLESLKRGCISILVNFEERFSRFKDSSLVSKLRRGESVVQDEDLVSMYSFAETLSEASNRSFSLFIGNQLVWKGYGKENVRSPDGKRNLLSVKDGSLVLSGEESLDFGGIGKGYVIDLLSSYLTKEGAPYHVINGGGDLYVTSDKHKNSLEIFLEHPLEEGGVLGKIRILNKGFAASSSFKRVWENGGKKVNHFITKTGEEVWGAIYTVADSCTVADTLATTLLLMENKREREALSKKYKTEYFLLKGDSIEKSFAFPHIQEV